MRAGATARLSHRGPSGIMLIVGAAVSAKAELPG
jgi:hypothetical protein